MPRNRPRTAHDVPMLRGEPRAALSSIVAERRPSTAPDAATGPPAPDWRVRLSALEKHDRRLFTLTPWSRPLRGRSRRFAGDLPVASTLAAWRNTADGKRMHPRRGLTTVVMMALALGRLRALRQGGRWLARSNCADAGRLLRPPSPQPQLAACDRAMARLAPGVLRLRPAATRYSVWFWTPISARPLRTCRQAAIRGGPAGRRADKKCHSANASKREAVCTARAF